MFKPKKIILAGLVSLFVVSFFLIAFKFVLAQNDPGGEIGGGDTFDSTYGTTMDAGVNVAIETEAKRTDAKINKQTFADRVRELLKFAWLKAGSQAFGSAVRTALNTFAYDAANQLASGGSGQGPAFETRSFGELFKDSLDAGAGDFLSTLGEEGMGGLNLCQPSLGVDVKIGLGLYQYKRPRPACTFSQMRDNWESEIRKATFLRDFQNYFEPTSNDLGIALSLNTMFLQKQVDEATDKIEDYKRTGGWLDIRNLAGKTETPASLLEDAVKEDITRKDPSWAQSTGDAFIDALNVFLNQLAIQLLRNLLWGGIYKGGGSGGGGLGVYDFDADSGASGGTRAAREQFRRIVQPRFDVRGDYSILAELTQCPDPNRAGPTNCVITERFRQAVQSRKTVGQALKEEVLNANGIFGFTSRNLEPLFFNENYPYRSMLILRKFRIIPVGWEVAASYINEHFGEEVSSNFSGKEDIRQMTLGQMIDCFDDDDRWCAGLVDPSWVLKAPLNYCARAGYGPETFGEPQLINGQYQIARKDNYCADEQSCVKENADGSCEIYGYCTQERRTWNFGENSCNPLYNSCQTYTEAESGSNISYLKNTLAYCGADAAGCERYSTQYNYTLGQWDTNIAGADQPVSSANSVYLNKNAESCDSASESCQEFIRVKPGLGTNIIPNSSFESGGAQNIDFWTPTNNSITKTEDSLYGQYALQFAGADSAVINFAASDIPLRDSKFGLQAGWRYILSVYFKTSDPAGTSFNVRVGDLISTPVSNVAGDQFSYQSSLVAGQTEWQRVSTIFTADHTSEDMLIGIRVNSGGPIIFDGIMLEAVTTANIPSVYRDYGESNVVHEKSLPDYLVREPDQSQPNYHPYLGACYDIDGSLYDDAPAICGNYARQCVSAEAGCERYTRVRDGFGIPAKVNALDYCIEQCDGYDSYVQSETNFETQKQQFLIPSTGRQCSAQAAGCDEFTNLDEVELGGEGIEYYSQLRQCTIESNDTAIFYVWEGSDESGFQLKSYTLEYDGANPAVTDGDTANNNHDLGGGRVCDETNYNLDPGQPDYSSDCRQIYNRNGGISYRFYSYTISYSTDCHPYRRSSSGDLAVDQADCPAANWDNTNQVCVYMAIPREGKQCSAAQNGCRKYTGNVANNIRNIITDNFDDNAIDSTDGWSASPLGFSEVVRVEDSVTVGGGSMKVSDTTLPLEVGKELTGEIQEGKSYVVEFLAKGTVANQHLRVDFNMAVPGAPALSVRNVNFTPELSGSSGIVLPTEWTLFTFNADYNTALLPGEKLHLRFSSDDLDPLVAGDFYIDYVILREVVDNYYIIKNSWNTPLVCDQDLDGNDAPRYMVGTSGCYEYSDRDNASHYLKSFSDICSESAVGCELMIDTQNYTPYNGNVWQDVNNNSSCDSNEFSCEKVYQDSFIYMVYDQEKTCGANEKACQLLGKDRTGGYNNTYLRNDPDTYDRSLCASADVGCSEYRDDNGGQVYFKNPEENVCEYRAGFDGNFGWWQKSINRCDFNNGLVGGAPDGKINHNINGVIEGVGGQPGQDNICLVDTDCGLGYQSACNTDSDCGGDSLFSCVANTCYAKCLVDSWDTQCDTDKTGAPKTVGIGGAGNRIVQPVGMPAGMAGLCPAVQSSCVELIDPVSKPSVNLLFNDDFSQDFDDNKIADGWEGPQSVNLKPSTLYKLLPVGVGVTLDTGCGSYRLDPISNSFADAQSPTITDGQLFIFISGPTPSCTIEATDKSVNPGGPSVKSIELKEAIVNYQLADTLDKTSCNGQVDVDNGCVLFNDREIEVVSGAGQSKTLIYNAEETMSLLADITQAPIVNCLPANGDCSANELIKVSPDRVCDEWLACRSQVAQGDENICYDIGICDGFGENNQCTSWVLADKKNQTVQINDTPTLTGPNGYGITPAQAANSTGYNIAGIYDTDSGLNSVEGYFPLGVMDQVGNVAVVPNGSFEFAGTNNYPIGWKMINNVSWTPDKTRIISNPVEAETLGVPVVDSNNNYIIDGRNFLQLGSSFGVESEIIEVSPQVGSEYIVSASVNTANLLQGVAKLEVFGIDKLSNGTVNNISLGSVSYAARASGKWESILHKFKIPVSQGSMSNIIIRLHVDGVLGNNGIGNFYFDNIRIRPALEIRDITPADSADNDFWISPQSCRLFPEADSLSCNYFNDSGAEQRGWYGYCLQYDRAPGNTNACLQWWPVGRVKGDGIDEGVGYLGRFPLYYTTEVAEQDIELTSVSFPIKMFFPATCNSFTIDDLKAGVDAENFEKFAPFLNKNEQTFSIGLECESDHSNKNSANLYYYFDNNGSIFNPITLGQTTSGESWCAEVYEHGGSIPARDSFNTDTCGLSDVSEVVCGNGGNCWKFCSFFDDDGSFDNFRYYTSDDSNDTSGWNCELTFNFKGYFAQTINQTVTPNAQNKYWSGRVYEGTDYAYQCNINIPIVSGVPNICEYNTDSQPFGAVIPPTPSDNPDEWTEQLFYLSDRFSGVKMGQEQSISLVQRIFAKSYGTWEWQNVSGAPNSCTYDITASKCSLSVSNCDDDNDCVLAPDLGNCVLGVQVCQGGLNNGEACADCNSLPSAELCDGSIGTNNTYSGRCGASTPLRGQICYGNNQEEATHICYGSSAAGAYCNTNLNLCVGGMFDDLYCETDEQCTTVLTGAGCQPSELVCANDLSLNCPIAGRSCNDWYNSASNVCIGVCSQSSESCSTFDVCPEVSSRYQKSFAGGWEPPQYLCVGAPEPLRPNYNNDTYQCERGTLSGSCSGNCDDSDTDGVVDSATCDYCAVPPVISIIEVNGINGNVSFVRNGVANITFQSNIETNQEPMIAYEVYWGDGESTSVAGVEMSDHPDVGNPHSLFHIYDYWDLVKKRASAQSGDPEYTSIYCSNGDGPARNRISGQLALNDPLLNSHYCLVKPTVWIKDNWGWYSGGTAWNQPPGAPDEFDGWIVVKQN
ncbi:MAG: hypothetical protein Q8Q23_04970 [bacterium]|nr:hypothetical protein [bacterium]